MRAPLSDAPADASSDVPLDALAGEQRLKDRIRVLEHQLAHLQGEYEDLKTRHEREIYSVAWHFGWPARVIERPLSRWLTARYLRKKAQRPPVAAPSAQQGGDDAAAIAARLLQLAERAP